MLGKLKKDIDRDIMALLKEKKGFLSPSCLDGVLYDCLRDFLRRKGKRIRPLLFLISYLGYTKKKGLSRKKLLRASLSLELLHDFLLMHDDVIDSSALRRGKPTLHRLFNKKLGASPGNILGNGLSIVAGDIIFAMAVESLLALNVPSIRKERAVALLAATAASTGMGEFADVVNNVRDIRKVTEKDVLYTYTMKTAKYTFEAPLLIGAALSDGASRSEEQKLSRLGTTLGVAFQIQDDLLDIFSSSKKTGKPVLSDLSESKKTLLVWKTHKDLSGKDKKLFERLLAKNKKTRSDLMKLKQLITSSEAERYCLDNIRSLLSKAEKICAGLRMSPDYKATIYRLIQNISPEIDAGTR